MYYLCYYKGLSDALADLKSQNQSHGTIEDMVIWLIGKVEPDFPFERSNDIPDSAANISGFLTEKERNVYPWVTLQKTIKDADPAERLEICRQFLYELLRCLFSQKLSLSRCHGLLSNMDEHTVPQMSEVQELRSHVLTAINGPGHLLK
jgi:hypothetical protein